MTRGKKAWTALITAVLLAAGVWSAYAYHHRAVNQWLVNTLTKGRSTNEVPLYFTSSIEEKTLRVGLTVVCNNKKQRREVMNREARIVHHLVNVAQTPRVVAFVTARDLGALRKDLQEVVNRETGSPVRAVYLDRFFFN